MIEAIGGSSKAALSGHQSDIYIPLGYCVLVLLIAGSLNPCAIVAACSTSITSPDIRRSFAVHSRKARVFPHRPRKLFESEGQISGSGYLPLYISPDIFPQTFHPPRRQFGLPFYMVWDISSFHHHHPSSYNIKRSTVNVCKIDSGIDYGQECGLMPVFKFSL